MGLLILHPEKKPISSRVAMQKTVESSCYYSAWPSKVNKDLHELTQAITEQNFAEFGRICESNALAMHASMLTAWPPIFYWTPESLQIIQKIWQLRKAGLPIYFTQDAGPNLKLLFLTEDLSSVRTEFNDMEVVWPFTPPNMNNHVVLVDEKDRATGALEKLLAHQQALCHRAFSVFVFRQKNQQLELLIQKRQHDKYHCGGLWTNTCCSHPRPGESLLAAAKRRLKEELGIEISLDYHGYFHYIAPFDNQLTENEVDHVFVSYGDPENLRPDSKEIADLRWMNVNDLKQQLTDTPHLYTPWFKQALEIALTFSPNKIIN
jgi:diphosphomevalonate decarboxylase